MNRQGWVLTKLYLVCQALGPNSGEGDGAPLQSSCLESPMDGGAWWAAVHGVAKSRTQLSNFTFTSHLHALEKEMATHSSVLAWRIPGMGEPGGLPSMRSHRVGHDWSDLAAAAGPNRCPMYSRYKWVPRAVVFRCWVQLFCDSMRYSPAGSSVHRISQARILEWVSMPSSRGSSHPRDQTLSPALDRIPLNFEGRAESRSVDRAFIPTPIQTEIQSLKWREYKFA